MTITDIYVHIIGEFLIELFVFYYLAFRGLNRKKGCFRRVIVGAVIMFCFALGASVLYRYVGDTVLGTMGIYFTLFAASVAVACFLFNESFFNIVFCCTLAYAAQNLVYKNFLIFYNLGEYADLFRDFGKLYWLYYRLMYYPYYAVAAVVFDRLLFRRIGKKLESKEYNRRFFVLSLAALAVTILFSSVEDVSFLSLVEKAGGHFYSWEIIALREAGNVFSVVCLALVIGLFWSAVRQRDLDKEIKYLQHAVEQSRRQYEMNKDIVDVINVKCHDIKYRISALADSGRLAADEVRDLNEKISIYDSNTDTGNDLLNVLFSEKRLYCEQHGITF